MDLSEWLIHGRTATLVADLSRQLLHEVTTRLDRLAALADAGGLDAPVEMITRALQAGGVVQAFGSGHSEALAMEIAGRAGGLVPTNRIALRDVVHRRRRGRAECSPRPPSSVTRPSSTSSETSPPCPARHLRDRVELRRERFDRRARARGQGARAPAVSPSRQPRADRAGRPPGTRRASGSATSPTSSSTTARRTATPCSPLAAAGGRRRLRRLVDHRRPSSRS